MLAVPRLARPPCQVSDVGLEAALTTRAIDARGERIVKRLDQRERRCLARLFSSFKLVPCGQRIAKRLD